MGGQVSGNDYGSAVSVTGGLAGGTPVGGAVSTSNTSLSYSGNSAWVSVIIVTALATQQSLSVMSYAGQAVHWLINIFSGHR